MSIGADPKSPPPAVVLEPIVLGLPEAAAVLCICPNSLGELAKAGAVPSFKLGRRRLFNRAALQRWADAQQAAALAEGGAL